MSSNCLEENRHVRRVPAWMCVVLMIIGYFLFTMLYMTVVQALADVIGGEETFKKGMGNFIAGELCMLLGVFTSVALLLRLERRGFGELGLSVRGHTAELLYGILAAIVFYGIEFGLSLSAGWVEIVDCCADSVALGISFGFFFLVALTEEVMIRGYILGRLLRTRLNKFLALLLSSILFALMHLFNPNITWLPMLNLMLAGVLLGASYLYTHNLCFPIGLHLFWNWIQGPVLGYEVSGSNFFPSMLQLRLSEDTLLNGGAFGFEGSLVCTALIMMSTVLLVWWGEKREAIRLVGCQSC